jgi:hypothetical protein
VLIVARCTLALLAMAAVWWFPVDTDDPWDDL